MPTQKQITPPFGQHLLLDGFGCDREALSDLLGIYKFLDDMPRQIHMTRIMPPHVQEYRSFWVGTHESQKHQITNRPTFPFFVIIRNADCPNTISSSTWLQGSRESASAMAIIAPRPYMTKITDFIKGVTWDWFENFLGCDNLRFSHSVDLLQRFAFWSEPYSCDNRGAACFYL